MNKSIPICSEFKKKTSILNRKGVYVQIRGRKTREKWVKKRVSGANAGGIRRR